MAWQDTTFPLATSVMYRLKQRVPHRTYRLSKQSKDYTLGQVVRIQRLEFWKITEKKNLKIKQVHDCQQEQSVSIRYRNIILLFD